MLAEVLVKNCSPTLAGIKIGSLFSYPRGKNNVHLDEIRSMNTRLNQKGLELISLRESCDKVLLFLYRKKALGCKLCSDQVREFLEERGYLCTDTKSCLDRLKERLASDAGFPHEIGLFLGYPLHDVKGFIENKSCKYCGMWKVYEHEDEAIALFKQYEACRSAYCMCLNNGWTIEQLAVAN